MFFDLLGIDGLLLAVIGLVVGGLIGCIGVGGVLLVPALTLVIGMPIHVAIASCMLSYLFSGLVGAIAYARQGTVRWEMCLWLAVGAMPGAYLGAVSVVGIPVMWLELFIATLVILAGIKSLSNAKDTGTRASQPRPATLFVIGFVTGLLSAMSGTGGPLVLVPLMAWLGAPMLVAVGLSQVIQLPIAALATIGNYIHGTVDTAVGFAIASMLMIGVLIGARIAHRINGESLRRLVAVALIVVGVFMIVKGPLGFGTGT